MGDAVVLGADCVSLMRAGSMSCTDEELVWGKRKNIRTPNRIREPKYMMAISRAVVLVMK